MPDNVLVKKFSEIDRILRNINWNFYPKPQVKIPSAQVFDTRKYHWFPATFVPEIPYTLIELLTKPKAQVLDPFLGIGTSYFQALLLNRIPFGVDISKIATNFSYSMLQLFDPECDLLRLNETIRILTQDYDKNYIYDNYFNETKNNPYIYELRRWYSADNFNAIIYLLSLERNATDRHMKAALWICISALLGRLSNQDRGWGCIADNVLPKLHQNRIVNVIKVFNDKVSSLLNDVYKFRKWMNNNTVSLCRKIIEKNTIFHSDIIDFQGIPEESIDLIITSPPYPNMVDYVMSQRLSYYCFGYDISWDKNNEIGARNKRWDKLSLDKYKAKMLKANLVNSKLLKQGGLLCYIMPSFSSDNENNLKRKTIISKIIFNLDELQLIREFACERLIPSLRRSHNMKWATLEKEFIYIYRKV